MPLLFPSRLGPIGLSSWLLLGACSAKPDAGAKPPTASHPAPAAGPSAQAGSRPVEAKTAAPPASAAPPPASAPAPPACQRMCATMQTLHCPNDPSDCTHHCAEMADIPVCKAEMGAFIACVARQPASASYCNDEGEAEIRDGFCDTEQKLVAKCMEQAN